jgi:hypothetical protein
MVLMTGVLNNMRSIVTGWYKETDSDVPSRHGFRIPKRR